MICQQIFFILALVIFLLKVLLKSASKSCFCGFGAESRFGAAISPTDARSSHVFCNSISRYRMISHRTGYVKVAW